MANKLEITLESLTKAEREAVLRFLREAYALYMKAAITMPFEVWINMLTQGIKKALVDYVKKHNH
jgi:hypothetical protein